jgi:hypothetical protein
LRSALETDGSQGAGAFAAADQIEVHPGARAFSGSRPELSDGSLPTPI